MQFKQLSLFTFLYLFTFATASVDCDAFATSYINVVKAFVPSLESLNDAVQTSSSDDPGLKKIDLHDLSKNIMRAVNTIDTSTTQHHDELHSDLVQYCSQAQKVNDEHDRRETGPSHTVLPIPRDSQLYVINTAMRDLTDPHGSFPCGIPNPAVGPLLTKICNATESILQQVDSLLQNVAGPNIVEEVFAELRLLLSMT